eukprot:2194997-Alexandrium_andersonii.AAC.1
MHLSKYRDIKKSERSLQLAKCKCSLSEWASTQGVLDLMEGAQIQGVVLVWVACLGEWQLRGPLLGGQGA